MVEINEAERKKELKEMRTTSETSIKLITIKCPNIWILGAPEDKKKGHKKILEEIIVENFPKIGKEIATQVQETQRVPKKDKPKAKYTKTHINQINKDQTQRTNIKSSKGKEQITHKGIPIRITADLSIRNSSNQKGMQDILKVLKEKSLQPRLLYPARISFKYEGEIKSFTDKQKLRDFSTTKPAQQMLKDLL